MKVKTFLPFPAGFTVAAAVAAALLAAGLPAQAQSTWTGGDADDSNWTSGDNWGGTAPTPSTTTDLVFAGDTRTTNNNDFVVNSDFRHITFNSAAGAFNLGGNTLNLRGNVTFTADPASPITQTISLGLQLTGGNRAIGGRANGSIQVDGVVSDDGTARNLQIGIATTPGGRVYLNGDNTFGGQLVGFGGTAVISSLSSNGLPSAAGASNMRVGNGVTAGNIEYTGGAVSVDKGLQVGFGTAGTHTAAGWFRNNGSGKLTFTREPFNPPHGTSIANRTLELGGSADIEIQGEIRDNAASANVAISKTGTNTLTLSGANTYSGVTTVEAGTLALSGSGSIANTPTITVADGAVLDVSEVSVSFALGSGQSLVGSGTVVGDLSDAAGSQLIPGGVASVGTLTFSNNLTLGGGGTLQLDLAVGSPGDKMVVLGDLEVSGTTTIEVANFPAPGTTSTIFEVTGSLGGSPANFTVSPATGYTVEYDTAGPVKKINLVRAVAAPLVWQGDGMWNHWDVGLTANWTNESGSAVTFQSGDGVVFDDTGSDTPAIYISTDVVPAGVLVSNSARSYTFWGAGKITGGTSLTKAGSGTLTLDYDNDYSGGTVISEGTLRVGFTGSLVGDVVNDGILVFDRTAALTMSGAISGTGQMIKNSDSTLTLTGSNTWSGGTLVNAGRLQIGANGTVGSIAGDIANQAELWFNRSDSLTYDGSISGSGSVVVAGGGSGPTTFAGAHSYTSVTTNRGLLILANPGGACLAGDLFIQGISGAPVEQVQLGAAEQIPDTALVTLGGNAACRFVLQGFNETIGGLVSSASGGNSIVEAASDGIADKPAVLTINVALGQSHSYAGALGAITWMRDAAGLDPEAPNSSPLTVVKAGPGTQIIGGGEENISFSGGLLITGGTLQLNNCTAINSVITNNASLIMDITDTRTRFNAITGAGTLTKQGFGTLILAGANTYSGSTTVSEGTLQLDLPSLDDSSAVYLAGTAVLYLNFEGTNRVGSFHVNGVDQGEGTFDSSTHPGLITGTGALQVGGSESGTLTDVVVSNGTNVFFNTGGSGSLIIQATTNLADPGAWVNLTTNMAPFDFTDTNAVQLYPLRFYRTKTP